MSAAPEKIYGWINSQLSIARFYGGIEYSGYRYTIDMADPDRPLVRADVLKAEQAAKAKAAKAVLPVDARHDSTGVLF
jgi:hypothetical protein